MLSWRLRMLRLSLSPAATGSGDGTRAAESCSWTTEVSWCSGLGSDCKISLSSSSSAFAVAFTLKTWWKNRKSWAVEGNVKAVSPLARAALTKQTLRAWNVPGTINKKHNWMKWNIWFLLQVWNSCTAQEAAKCWKKRLCVSEIITFIKQVPPHRIYLQYYAGISKSQTSGFNLNQRKNCTSGYCSFFSTFCVVCSSFGWLSSSNSSFSYKGWAGKPELFSSWRITQTHTYIYTCVAQTPKLHDRFLLHHIFMLFYNCCGSDMCGKAVGFQCVKWILKHMMLCLVPWVITNSSLWNHRGMRQVTV